MQIKQETADRIMNNLLDLIEEKKRKIDALNDVIEEQAYECIEKSEQIKALLSKRGEDD